MALSASTLDAATSDAAVAASIISANQFVTFSCGSRILAVDIMAVREIRSWSPLTELPDLPRGARGVLDIRGRIVPVYDLSYLIGTPEVEGAPVIVVVSHMGEDLGIMVSAVSDIIFAQPDQIRAVPNAEAGGGSVAAIIRHEDKLVSVLSLSALFPSFANKVYLD